MPPQVVVQVFGGGVGRVERNRQRQFILNNIPMLAPSAKYTKKHGIFMLQKRAWMHRGFSRGDFLIFYCFMVLCFDFELWTHFSWEFQGGHICTNSFKHVFIALRAESRVLGREELTMWPRHKKLKHLLNLLLAAAREYCILLICLPSYLHDFIFSTKPVQ